MGSINKETAIFLSSTEVKGKRATQSFLIMAKAIGNLLLPVWNALLDVAIPTLDTITKGIRGMSQAIRTIPDIASFLTNPFSILGRVFGKNKDIIKEVNKETKDLNETNRKAAEANKQQEESIEKVTEALIDVNQIRKEEKALIERNRDVTIAALAATGKLQKAQNESIRNAIRETRSQLRELESEAERAAKFSQRILDEIAKSQKRIAQAEFDPLEILVDDLERAEDDFKEATRERAAGNIARARELTLSAVQAANAILEVKKDAEEGSEITRSELTKATREAESLVRQAKNFAMEMETAAKEAIPLVEAELKSLEGQLQAGKDTLAGIKDSISEAKRQAVELKAILNQDTTATHTQIINTINTGGNSGPGFNTGGPIPGYGGGDRVPIMAEGGEHVIRKESVKKLGRDAAHAFNRGDIKGLIQALPVQHLKEGGEVKSEGSTNVNLIMGDKAFPMTAKVSVADEFVGEIKSINVVRGRKKNVY